MPAYVTQAQLEAQYTPRRVQQVFTDDGSSTLDAAKLNSAIERASAVVDAMMGMAYPDPVSRAALAGDPVIVGLCATLVMHYGASRRPEYVGPEGQSPYAQAAKEAKAELELIAQGRLRLAAEDEVGANPVRSGATTVRQPVFLFAPRGGRDPGGF